MANDMKHNQTSSALTSHDTDASLIDVLSQFPKLKLALVFGSVATGQARSDSDLDIAVASGHTLSATEKIAMISALTDSTGVPVT